MTNPKCPFCKAESSKHEAGRCLNHWIEAVKFNKGRKNPAGKEEETKFLTWAKDNAKPYSTDMNAAMTLWQDIAKLPNVVKIHLEYIVSIGKNAGMYIVNVYLSGSRLIQAHSKTPATAMCRAYLEEKNETK